MTTVELPVTDTYEDVRRLLYKICWIFKQRCGGDFEDLESEANIAFMRAYKTYEPNHGTRFTSYLGTCVYRRLELFTAKRIRSSKLWAVSLDRTKDGRRTSMAATVIDESFDRVGFSEKLSRDGNTILKLVLDSPTELVAMARAKGGTPRNWSSSLREYLRNVGWTLRRIGESFEEIGKAL